MKITGVKTTCFGRVLNNYIAYEPLYADNIFAEAARGIQTMQAPVNGAETKVIE